MACTTMDGKCNSILSEYNNLQKIYNYYIIYFVLFYLSNFSHTRTMRMQCIGLKACSRNVSIICVNWGSQMSFLKSS